MTSRSNPGPASQSVFPKRVYRAGTLSYTAGGLGVLSLWLLGGDFAGTFFESVFTRFIPLYLKDINASNNVIGLMTGSFAGLVNILFLPNISQWSDRCRSSRGRRIPFLYVATPVTVLALLGIGFAPEIADWLSPHLKRGSSSTSLVLPLLCGFVVAYHFFNMVLVNAYNWLIRDVVPQELIARFLSCFRIVATVSSFAFLWYVYPQVETHRREVFLGVSVFYLAVFLLMCWNVKEGEHPELPAAQNRPGLLESFLLYFRECLRVPLYRNFFLTYVLVTLAISCAGPFAILFARETLGLDLGTMGKIFACAAAATAIIYWPMGWLCDKFSALSVSLIAMGGFVLGSVLAFYFVAGKESLLVYCILFTIPSVAWGMGSFAASMRLFPEQKFGQFSSGLSVFSCGAIIPGNYLAGTLMDLVHSNYRVNYLWSAVLFTLAIPPMFAVYHEWKRLGGPDAYVPPLP